MKIFTAIKLFWYALINPEKAERFLQETISSTRRSRNAHTQENASDVSHLHLIKSLQESGRLIDFLQEDLSSYNDHDIGASVRKIQRDCAKILEEYLCIQPILFQEEGSIIDIPEGYDPRMISVEGAVKGKPPYKARILHKGWKAEKTSLPKNLQNGASNVLQQAQVEV